MERKPVLFTEAEANAAADEWNFNCGPAALCAVLDMTPAQLRPHLIDFEQKGYTNPSLMFAVLNNLKIEFRKSYRSDLPPDTRLNPYPLFGLVRIQWGGPWTKPGVPMRVRYRQTHWVACRRGNSKPEIEIFAVNAMCRGGWLSFYEWSTKLIPWLIRECVPKGDGTWWPTHGIAITPTVS
jgi:hypothetical protein